MHFSLTIVLVAITVLVSIGGFTNQNMIDDLIFYPPAVKNRNQWYRFFSHGFIHADAAHLAFNMFALWSFGEGLEAVFQYPFIFDKWGKLVFLLLYFSALFMASFPDYNKYKDSYHFRSLGASGAVSAVMFSFLLFSPQTKVGIIFLPIQAPGWIFGILYLVLSYYLDKRGGGNINHGAHFWGAVYGIVFTILACYFFTDFNLLQNFLRQLRGV